MKKVKVKKRNFLLVIYLLTFVFVTIGTTFSYFTGAVASEKEKVAGGASVVGINLSTEALYTEKALIPTNDDDIMKAYNQECIDDLGNGACQAYTITIENIGTKASYAGTVNFNLDHITNLNYLILDEADEIYLDKTAIVSETDESLGDEFELETNEKKIFKLVIWVPNYEYDQNDEDGAGTFNATVTYKTFDNGGKITGTILSTIEKDDKDEESN